jgi:hypothetical protein
MPLLQQKVLMGLGKEVAVLIAGVAMRRPTRRSRIGCGKAPSARVVKVEQIDRPCRFELANRVDPHNGGPIEEVQMQFSLKTLAGTIAFIAIACCSLVYASSAWSSALFTAGTGLLIFAVLAAIYRPNAARAFWIGCAVSGWAYLLLTCGPFSTIRPLDERGRFNRHSELATAHLARWTYRTVLPKIRQPPAAGSMSAGGFFSGGMMGGSSQMPMGGMGAGEAGSMAGDNGMSDFTGSYGGSVSTSSYPDETSFIRVSHALSLWLFALAGGIAGRWLSKRRAG